MEPEFVKPDLEFKWPEYIVFGLVLAASLGIGLFYGFFGNKNKTNEEFLMAGRSMGIFPVTLSLICTFVSAITLLGNPVEIYFYGTQYMLFSLTFPILTLLLAYIYVPVYVRLRLTSAYEYCEWRFSLRVRMFCSVCAILYLMIYMPTTVYGPSLALDQVAGINKYISCAAIFLVCIAYSSLGGLKAVLWTDALQGVVMIASLLAIVIAGVKETDGFASIVEKNSNTDRIEFFNMDLDPRTRHTFWTSIFGGLGFWLPIFAATQAQIQRYNSVPNLRSSRITLVLNMIGLMFITLLTTWIGMMVYAKYQDCDPVGAKIITSPDQLVPLYVMEVLNKYPGLPGLLVGGLTCGSLSSISSALNSMTALITEDFVKHYRPNMSEEKLALASKIISTVAGCLAFLVVFPIAAVNETIQISPFAILLAGCLVAPILGIFTLGMFLPWANEIGVLLGVGLTVAICGFQGLGSIFAGRIAGKLPDQKLFLTTEGCETTEGPSNFTFISSNYTNPWKERGDSWEIQIWSISYLWLPGMGIGGTLLFGALFSAIINASSGSEKRQLVPERLFAFPLLTLWKKTLGIKYLSSWVEWEQSKTTEVKTAFEFDDNHNSE